MKDEVKTLQVQARRLEGPQPGDVVAGCRIEHRAVNESDLEQVVVFTAPGDQAPGGPRVLRSCPLPLFLQLSARPVHDLPDWVTQYPGTRIDLLDRSLAYRHFRGSLYKVLGCARDLRDGTTAVVYQSQDRGHVWHRPIQSFNAMVEDGGKPVRRFLPQGRDQLPESTPSWPQPEQLPTLALIALLVLALLGIALTLWSQS